MGLLDWMSGDGAGGRDNPWRRLYNPGSAPNPKKMEGASSYDTVGAQDKAPTVWDQVLKSESFKTKTFDDIDTNHDGVIDAAELRRAVGPSAPSASTLVAAADKGNKGAISRPEFDAVMGRHFGTA